MFYADTIGLENVLARIQEFEQQHGPDLSAPSQLLKQRAENGGSFAQYDRAKEENVSRE